MSRYVIALGDPENAADRFVITQVRGELDRASGWKVLLDQTHCYVVYRPDAAHADSSFALQGQSGAILGRIYRRSSPSDLQRETKAPLSKMSASECRRVVESRGRSLISDYWGHYVALLLETASRQAIVLRSPVSPLPCLHLERATLQLFFSHVEDCIRLNLVPLTINWDAIGAQVVGGDYLTAETGLNEIDALDGGQCVICTPQGGSKVRYWDPVPLLGAEALADFDEAVAATLATTLDATASVAAPHSHLLVHLSGGLDSSIVLHALQQARHRPALTAINYYSRGSGDERPFARRMAQAVGCRLLELPRNESLDLKCFESINWTVQPVLHFSAPDAEPRTLELARQLDATAIGDGELGDNLFGSNPMLGAVLQCIDLRGMGPAALGAAIDFAMLTRQSLWRVMRLARAERRSLDEQPDFSALREMRRRYSLETSRSLILASAEAETQYQEHAARFLHPWLKGTRRMAPYAHSLLFGLIMVTSSAYASPFGRPGDAERLSPLITQPVLELMFKIPAYLHFRHGQNRAVARTAFAARLPAEILQRGTGKGGPILWAKTVIDNNVPFLREFLLDGILVERGLLDRRKLEAVLSPTITKSTAMVGDVFAKIYIEAWLKKWQAAASAHCRATAANADTVPASTPMGLPHPAARSGTSPSGARS